MSMKLVILANIMERESALHFGKHYRYQKCLSSRWAPYKSKVLATSVSAMGGKVSQASTMESKMRIMESKSTLTLGEEAKY